MSTLNSEEGERRDEVLRLFIQNQTMLSAFLYSLVEDWEIVEEALQESAVFICARWQDFVPGSNFNAWARTVSRMRCREVLQRKRRSSAQSLDSVLGCVAEPVREEVWEEHGTYSARHKEALSKCLTSLSEQHRRVIVMHYEEKMQCDGIAKRLQKSVESIYMTLTRIRKRLRQCVEQRFAQEAQ